MNRTLFFVLFCFLISAQLLNCAEISFPAFISNGMVLQQRSSAPLWGKSTKNSEIKVVTSWDSKKYLTLSDEKGNWKLSVTTPKAGGPYSITFEIDGSMTTLNDILIGEVWLCSGQSNMEMPMKGFKNQPVEDSNMEILKSANPNLRLFTVKRNSTIESQEDVSGEWQAAKPVSVKEFSATGYYFGKLLQEMLNVPVGLINSSWGGSWIESWMNSEMLTSFPEVEIPKDESDIREKNRTPTTLYNAMIAPLAEYGIRGVIWYQGESNYDRHETYTKLFKTMVDGWRTKWNQGIFPFYYCQIAPYEYGLITPEGEETINSAYLREAQLKAEKEIENSGMAVLMDAGMENGIHPVKKRVAGERLALHALAKTYNFEGITADSPVYKEMSVQGDTCILSFDRAEMWLTAREGELNNFTVAGEDRVFYPAEAWISRSKVHVKSEAVKFPVAVRYAFENYVDGDLYGTEGLPVSSFRTDNW
ncbi:MAG: sialate O-acetylesterase [Fermentimonas sp.]|nr:sialate O-acetylesterase [Fermentimonas sp.]MDD4695993.1 sialate O-acetylesterase [Fermentimonas sp.]